MQALQWMFESMSSGRRPEKRWDGSAWSTNDDLGALALSRPCLSYRAALIYIKGDWSEHAHALGISPWSSLWSPCQFCTLVKSEIHSMYGDMLDPEGMQWQLRDGNSYEVACKKCEIHVRLITPLDRRTLLNAMRWRKTKSIGGRLVVEDVNVNFVQLLVGDRLEPSKELLDTHNIERAALPINIVLWRTYRDWKSRSLDCVSHRCALFDQRLGTTPHDNLAVDELHTLYFGPIMRYVSASMWRVVLANTWGFVGTIDQIVELGTRQVSNELLVWQDDMRVPRDQRLSAITPKMLGKRKGHSVQDVGQ